MIRYQILVKKSTIIKESLLKFRAGLNYKINIIFNAKEIFMDKKFTKKWVRVTPIWWR